jgi:hypothetical protein
MMKIAFGLALIVLGALAAGLTFVVNSGGGALGPIPFFGGCFVALVGLIVTVVAL